MRALNQGCISAVMCVLCGMAAPVRAQSDVELPLDRAVAAAARSMSAAGNARIAPALDLAQVIRQPADAPPTPRHTGIRAMVKGLVVDFKYLPSRENLFWAGVGGGLALAAHPLDDDLNRKLVNNSTAENVFRPGEILGQLGTLLGSASVVYAVGRLNDQPKVSHVGMDLIQSIAMAETLTQTVKFTTRRERPDLSGRTSFPSGHAADTFAFATAVERHLGWRYAVPAYTFASYVAISRLPANRHWFSDTLFGAATGIIAGRTVTSREAHPFPVAVNYIPGGISVMYVRQGPQLAATQQHTR
jgi:membrane-associated phospholipid phosphatase